MFIPCHSSSDARSNSPGSTNRAAAGARASRRSGRLLGLIRRLIDHGKDLAAIVREPPPLDQLLCIGQDFRTCDPAVIIARIERGLRIAAALEDRIVNCAAYIDKPRTPKPAPARPRDAVSQAQARRAQLELAEQTPLPVAELQDDPGAQLDRRPTLEKITSHVSNRPIGIILTEICQDIGIGYKHQLWWELLDAIDLHGGNYARFERVVSGRKPVFDFFSINTKPPLPALPEWQSPSAASGAPVHADPDLSRRFDNRNAVVGAPLPSLQPSSALTGRPPFLAPLPCRAHIPPMQTVITVTLNGESRSLDGPVSVSGLLESLGFEGRKVAVERNEAIVSRSRYAETWLATGDSLEIVHFIGGG
jgi:sulfur carrier protein